MPMDAYESVIVYALAICILEFLELYWQRGNSLLHIILYNYSILKTKGIMTYMSMHISFIFITYLAIVVNSDIAWTIFTIKILDVGYKFYLLGKISDNKMELRPQLLQLLASNMGYLKYATCFLYPIGFVFL